jgi:phospholipid/cholesterol/gamma-HCH transport system permease protein
MADGFPTTLWRAAGRLGERIWAEWDELIYAAAVIGTALFAGVRPRTWTAPVRRAFAWQVLSIGVESTGFVLGVAVLVGITVVVHMVSWIREAGQPQVIGPILVTLVGRELSPVLIGLIVIIYSGSTMAAELAIMRIDGQVDSLEGTGADPFFSLVLPRVLGAAVSAFCLTVLFILVALASGYLFRVVTGAGARDIRLVAAGLTRAISPWALVAIFLKSALPGLYIGASCCITGLNAGPSMAEIPKATQRAMLRSIVGLFTISTTVSILEYLW